MERSHMRAGKVYGHLLITPGLSEALKGTFRGYVLNDARELLYEIFNVYSSILAVQCAFHMPQPRPARLADLWPVCAMS